MAQDLDVQIKIEALTQQAQQAMESLNSAFKELVDQSKKTDVAVKKTESTIDNAAKSFDRAGKSLKKFGDNVSNAGKELTLKLTSVLVGIGLLAAKEFGQAEEEAFKLSNALRAFGRNSDSSQKQFKALADEFERFTRFSGGAVTEAAALATQFTKSNAETEKLVRSAAELASVSGMDLNQAIKVLGATMEGQTGLISRQYPELNKLTEEQLKAGAAVDYFLSRFGGSAAASAQTFNGQIIQLRNNINSLLELIGETLAPYIRTLVNGLNSAVDALKRMDAETREQVVLWGAFAAAIGPILVGLGSLVNVIGSAAVGFGKLLTFLKPLALIFSPTGAFVAGVAALGFSIAGLVNVFAALMEAGVKTGEALELTWNLIASSFNDYVVVPINRYLGKLISSIGGFASYVSDDIGNAMEKIGAFMQETANGLDGKFDPAKAKIDEKLKSIGSSAGQAFSFGLSDYLGGVNIFGDGFAEKMKTDATNASQQAADSAGAVWTQEWEEAYQRQKAANDKIQQQIEQRNNQIAQNMSNNLADSFLDVADGTKSAKEAMEDFAKSTLRYIAQIILQEQILNAVRAAGRSMGFGFGGVASGGLAGTGPRKAAPSAGTYMKQYASGGAVYGAGGPRTDSIPAWLSNGEFVMQASAVRTLGLGFMNAVNNIGSKGGLPAYADGGMVSGSGRGTSVEIVNSGSEKQVSNAEEDPVTGVITIFLEDMGKNGPISKSVASTFNLKRGGFR